MSNPLYYIDIEFSRLIKEEDQNDCFTLKRIGRDYTFELHSSDATNKKYIIDQWTEALSSITIRELGCQFNVIKQIGKGSYSNVYKVEKADEKKQIYALKVLRKYQFKDQSMREQLLKEIRIQRNLNCGNIIKIHQVQEDDKYVYLVLDYIEGGTLRDFLQKGTQFNEQQIRQITLQILLSVDYLHHKKIIHRDLKPENILLSFQEDQQRPDAFLADFGFAVTLDDESSIQNIYGTPGYVSPEVLRGEPYTHKSDIFSLGAILFNMVAGRNLFSAKNAQEALLKNIKCNIAPHIQDLNCTTRLKNLLEKLLSKDPNKRVYASQALNHDWFSKDLKVIRYSLFINENEAIDEEQKSISTVKKQNPLIKHKSRSFRKEKHNTSKLQDQNFLHLTPQLNQNQQLKQLRNNSSSLRDLTSSITKQKLTYNQIMDHYLSTSNNLNQFQQTLNQVDKSKSHMKVYQNESSQMIINQKASLYGENKIISDEQQLKSICDKNFPLGKGNQKIKSQLLSENKVQADQNVSFQIIHLKDDFKIEDQYMESYYSMDFEEGLTQGTQKIMEIQEELGKLCIRMHKYESKPEVQMTLINVKQESRILINNQN
ncbi:serine threonine protein kinase [Stylonychia lemnae]|uniref:Serine threonine protein kinase n=1 Tax=Stylonychia lemnae TaxID=5949 RepID=A0A078B1W4_STYLE|nr:serine threonine protein kinase [Stylonychia lemnae]|eukprot:CDW87318.1 serine threonine protein kinase [Stylonychia lemnae]